MSPSLVSVFGGATVLRVSNLLVFSEPPIINKEYWRLNFLSYCSSLVWSTAVFLEGSDGTVVRPIATTPASYTQQVTVAVHVLLVCVQNMF